MLADSTLLDQWALKLTDNYTPYNLNTTSAILFIT